MRLDSPNIVKGFTLIEVMVVVGVISILAAVAWPMYQTQSLKNGRANAVIALTRVSNELNKFFSDNQSYTGYTVSTTVNNGLKNYSLNLALTASTYTVTATPSGAQADDLDCTTLTINHLGQKGYTGAAPSAVRCWGSTN